jgi:hypothetical protein
MSGGTSPGGTSPGWGLRIAFAVNILVMLFALYSAFIVISFLYCFRLWGQGCDPWASHIPSALIALAFPALALVGTACGVRFARRGERRRAVRALLGWTALSLVPFAYFVIVGV